MADPKRLEEPISAPLICTIQKKRNLAFEGLTVFPTFTYSGFRVYSFHFVSGSAFNSGKTLHHLYERSERFDQQIRAGTLKL